MFEYLPVPFNRQVKKFVVDSEGCLVRLSTRNRSTETKQPPLAVLGLRKHNLDGVSSVILSSGLVIKSLWCVRVLCVDGMEYSWSGELVGPGLPHLTEYTQVSN